MIIITLAFPQSKGFYIQKSKALTPLAEVNLQHYK